MEGKRELCGICYDKELVGKNSKILCCGHKICKICFLKLQSDKCPYCRKTIKRIETPSIPIYNYSQSLPNVNQINRIVSNFNPRSVDNYLFDITESRVGKRIKQRNKNEKRIKARIDDPRVDIEQGYIEDELMFEMDE